MSVGALMSLPRLLGTLLSPQGGVELPPGSPWPSQPLRGCPNLSVCVFSPQGVQEDEPQREGEALQDLQGRPRCGWGDTIWVFLPLETSRFLSTCPGATPLGSLWGLGNSGQLDGSH